ncbi:hypothetical protein ACJJIW_15980 [Microbulbifer sp. JMSA004]|uniref:hypothetical protein n=1 Tax=Microbulbifer sp. JMSA004 TaxID=3243370 RepID=UPI004039433A
MYGKGYLIGIVAALVLWLLLRYVDKRYYQKKRELKRKKLQEIQKKKRDDT